MRYARIAPEEIIAACGGGDMLPSLFIALLQPGEHVVVQSLVYQPLGSVAAWCGAEVSLWAADEGAGQGAAFGGRGVRRAAAGARGSVRRRIGTIW